MGPQQGGTLRRLLFAALLATLGTPSRAQDAPVERTDAEWQAWVPEPSSLQMPHLSYVEDRNDVANYEKYYFFFAPTQILSMRFQICVNAMLTRAGYSAAIMSARLVSKLCRKHCMVGSVLNLQMTFMVHSECAPSGE